MIYRRGIIFLLLASGLTLLVARLSAEDAVHVVAKGETVYSISRSYQVSPEELMSYNEIADASKLQVGRRLRIPSPAIPTGTRSAPFPLQSISVSPAASGRAFTEYRVVQNDTLYSIARAHGITLQALRDINGFSKNYVLKAGERIKIPGLSAGIADSGNTKTIQPQVRQTVSKTVDASLRWPVSARDISYMTGKLYGVLLSAGRSEPVKSLTQGTVVAAGPYRGFGRVAIVQTSGGYLYVYGGCESLSVKEGDRIGPGTELGRLGIDAVSGIPQLVFMVYRNNAPIDPAKAPRA